MEYLERLGIGAWFCLTVLASYGLPLLARVIYNEILNAGRGRALRMVGD